MKGIKYVVFAIPIFAFGFFLIYSPKSNENVRYTPSEDLNEQTFFIGPNLVECEREEDCFQIKEDADGDYEIFSGTIEGFEFTEGLEKEIRVIETVDNSYELETVISINNINESRLANEENYPKETLEDITELSTRTLEEGIGGETVSRGQTVVANYTGWLASNGEVFDSSFKSGNTDGIEFSLNSVIQGWQEGVPGMKVGEVRRIFIPSELAYGEAGTSNIPPNSDLIFDVELMAIK